MRDGDLIERCRQGDRRAFDELYYAHCDEVRRLLTRILGPDGDVEDVQQNTFLQVFRSIRSFDGRAKFSTWLHRVTVNVAYQHLRKVTRARKRDAASWGRERVGDLRAQVDARDDLRRAYAALERLDPKKRIAFVLYEFESNTLEEVAAATGARVSTVAARVQAARKALVDAVTSHRRLPASQVG